MADQVTMVIDCDAGVDDAVAIMMALGQPNVQLIAVTCVDGNVSLDKVTLNVLRVLQKCDHLSIPVYSGASKDILGTATEKSTVHGVDGLGDIPNQEQPPSKDLIQSEHAVLALVRMVNERPGQITLVAIGPLTNVALAMRLDADFTSKLKELIIMGGNIRGTGTRFLTSEFNFTTDPTAAEMVLTGVRCPTIVVPLETCLSHSISYDWFDDLCQKRSAKAKFVSAMYEGPLRRSKKLGRAACAVPDGCAVAVASCGESIQEVFHVPCKVEMCEGLTKGQMQAPAIVRPFLFHFEGPQIDVVTKFDMDKYYQMLDSVVR
ncbi:nucleoside hydrolase-like [Diadema setosum]|uniref:nucleoside hydrolase-like n=1 Tax=Diadema setosum TaxID=31175 RepID=UPI003B3A845F